MLSKKVGVSNMYTKYDSMTPDELRDELRDLEAAINNEKIWALGSVGDERSMHKANISMLVDELEYVRGLLEETEAWLS